MSLWKRFKPTFKGGQTSDDVISAPFDVEHNEHVEYSKEDGYTGIPAEWLAKLNAPGVVIACYDEEPNEMSCF
eukprot:CAMPEP_0168530312 /NCGR_PEP_ID=MMETSP0405-20121227/14579_1 /TAXON_ID=498012 /ORGANISM="Trichosphaerium sp, Strain Am-I-7 wt" /LENGTH=72 /DNA_ID=CAMNT_0008554503 /DNA_START=89 /DNA_END=307 /DNA_ORIENTATION=+